MEMVVVWDNQKHKRFSSKEGKRIKFFPAKHATSRPNHLVTIGAHSFHLVARWESLFHNVTHAGSDSSFLHISQT